MFPSKWFPNTTTKACWAVEPALPFGVLLYDRVHRTFMASSPEQKPCSLKMRSASAATFGVNVYDSTYSSDSNPFSYLVTCWVSRSDRIVSEWCVPDSLEKLYFYRFRNMYCVMDLTLLCMCVSKCMLVVESAGCNHCHTA